MVEGIEERITISNNQSKIKVVYSNEYEAIQYYSQIIDDMIAGLRAVTDANILKEKAKIIQEELDDSQDTFERVLQGNLYT